MAKKMKKVKAPLGKGIVKGMVEQIQPTTPRMSPAPYAMAPQNADALMLDDGKLLFPTTLSAGPDLQSEFPSWKTTALGDDPEFPKMVERAALLARFSAAIEKEKKDLAETLDALMEAVEVEDFSCGQFKVHKYIHKSSSITRERLLNAGVPVEKINQATLTTEKTKCRISPLKEVGVGVVKQEARG